MNSFAGEFLAFLGAFQSSVVFGVLGTLVVIPAAWYMLRFFQGAMEGVAPEGSPVVSARLADLRVGEWLPLLPLLVLIFFLGVVPHVLTQPMQQPVGEILRPYAPAKLTATEAASAPIRAQDTITVGTVESHPIYVLQTTSAQVSNEMSEMNEREQARVDA